MQVLLNKNTKRSKLIGVANVAQLTVLDFLDVTEGGLGTTVLSAPNAILTSNGSAVQAQSSLAFDGTVFAVHGDAIVSNSASGRVGIRTSEPGNRLTIDGDTQFGNVQVLDRTLQCSFATASRDSLEGLLVPSESNASVLEAWHARTATVGGAADWTFDPSRPRIAQSALGGGYVDAVLTDYDVVLMIPASLPGSIGVYDVPRKTFRDPIFVDQMGPVAGARLLRSGKVLLTTRTARFFVVDLADGTATEASTTSAVQAVQGQADAYLSGGTRMPDGRILFAPGTAPRACAYDPATGTVDFVGPVFSADPTIRKFASAVLLPNGRACYVPYDSDRMVVYDLLADSLVFDVAFPLDSPGVNPPAKFSTGILGPSGTEVLFLPKDLSYVLVLNPVTFGNTKIPVATAAVPDGFGGGLLAPDGKVVLVPRASTNVVVLDLAARTRTDVPGQGYGGQVLASDGTIVLAPRTATRVGLLGPYRSLPVERVAHPFYNA